MAAELAECADLFEIAEPMVGPNLIRLCTRQTDVRWSPEMLQPAIFITSVGAMRALQQRGLRPAAVAGHSLGELTALVAAEVVSFEHALGLVSTRAQAMARAARTHPGGMAAVLGLPVATLEHICADIDGAWVANVNSPMQVVVSGTDDGLARAAGACLNKGAKRVVRLQVPLAGHSPLMQDAATELVAALEHLDLRLPRTTFYSTVDARRHSDPDEIRRSIAAGVTQPVRFSDTVEAMRRDGVSDFVEVGPGNVLSQLVRQSVPDARIARVGTDGEADALAFSLARPA